MALIITYGLFQVYNSKGLVMFLATKVVLSLSKKSFVQTRMKTTHMQLFRQIISSKY